jgi:hypothetical protein
MPSFPRRRARLVALSALSLALGLGAAPAIATVYKCLLDDGSPFYQDLPCPPGRELRDFDKDPSTVSVVPFGQPAPQKTPSSGKRTGTDASSSGAGRAAKSAAVKVPKGESKPARKTEPRGDAAQRKFLRPGMSEGEVIARVGPPDMTSSGGRKGARWTYMPVPEDAHTMTNLQLEKGRVIDVERKVLR